MARIGDQRGQSTVEWVALVLVVAFAFGVLAAVTGTRLPGAALARTIVEKLACAAGIGDCAGALSALELAYGREIAALVDGHVPTLRYEPGMAELPVDYRLCRDDPCAQAAGEGAVWRTDGGDRAVAFTHVIDCRPPPPDPPPEPLPDCTGPRAGNLYLQYWLYYPDSQTDPWGGKGYHPDDWESFQVRIGADTAARASSHHSYNYEGGIRNWASDAGVIPKAGWGPFTGELHVSAGSHAGHVADDERPPRFTPGSRLLLIPIEAIAASGADDDLFEVTPPWLKRVYLDPESEQT